MVRPAMKETLYEYCQRTGRLELVAEWDAKKNAPFTPRAEAGAAHGGAVQRGILTRC